jgi:hypothetical protein
MLSGQRAQAISKKPPEVFCNSISNVFRGLDFRVGKNHCVCCKGVRGRARSAAPDGGVSKWSGLLPYTLTRATKSFLERRTRSWRWSKRYIAKSSNCGTPITRVCRACSRTAEVIRVLKKFDIARGDGPPAVCESRNSMSSCFRCRGTCDLQQ